MAGDINIDEHVVVLPTGTPSALAAAHLETAGARIMHRYGPNVLVVEPARAPLERLRGAVPFAAVEPTIRSVPPALIADLDPAGKLGLEAFERRQSEAYQDLKLNRPHADASWDTPGLLPPDPPPHLAHLTRPPAIVIGNTSERMTGNIAVGIIIVSGPTQDLAFSRDEVTNVVAEVQNGLGWLGAQYPLAKVAWSHDINVVPISQPANPKAPDLEAWWRDPAMQALGYGTGWAAIYAYANYIKAKFGADWTYVAYFTKYDQSWFAYAYLGGPHLCMQYSNDGWGPSNIDRVFAHETGHVFQAPDEYASIGCDCGGSWGWYNQPNGNCANCAPGGGEPCIMGSNAWSLCQYTPWHFGVPFPRGMPINNTDNTPLSPATCTFNGKTYIFWQASDSSNAICYSTSSDGITWSASKRINTSDSTSDAPSVCVYDDRLYVFWKANDPSNRLLYSYSTDGATWPSGRLINEVDSSSHTPAPCVFGGWLYLFFVANNSTNTLLVTSSPDGLNWFAATPINDVDSTPATPSACVFDNKIYLFWLANNSSNQIYCTASTGSYWPHGGRVNMNDSTSASPACCVHNNQIYLFWKANDSSNAIFISNSPDGFSWAAGQKINNVDSTGSAPAVVTPSAKLMVAWRANDPSNRIFYSYSG